jgi:thiamine-phosphate pyrophosphorylase
MRMGADYCGVGPMFATITKKKDTIAGPGYLRSYLDAVALPHLAIGGIHPGNVGELIDIGVCGIAVSSCVCASDDPAKVVETLVTGIRARSTDDVLT